MFLISYTRTVFCMLTKYVSPHYKPRLVLQDSNLLTTISCSFMNNYGYSYGYKCNTKHTHEKAPETTRYSNSHARSIFQHELLQTVAVDVRHILLTCAAEWPNVAK